MLHFSNTSAYKLGPSPKQKSPLKRSTFELIKNIPN